MKKRFDFNWVSRYRNEIFGVSILSIMIFHFCEDYAKAVKQEMVLPLDWVSWYNANLGSIGVEIFLFLSGMGLYFAWSKGTVSLTDFYKKRLSRVLICYLPFGAVFWGASDLLLKRKGVFSFLLDYSTLSFWTEGNRAVWFISLILILYFLFPLFYRWMYPNGKCCLWSSVLLVVIIVAGTYILRGFNSRIYADVEIALTRIPVFLAGIYAGHWIKEHKKVHPLWIALLVILSWVLQRQDVSYANPLGRYIVSFWSLALIALLCLVFVGLEKLNWKWIRLVLQYVGGMSLELYLSHVMIRSLFRKIGYPTYQWQNYLVAMGIAVGISVLFHEGMSWIKAKSRINSV